MWYKKRGLLTPSYKDIQWYLESSASNEEHADEVPTIVEEPPKQIYGVNFVDGQTQNPKLILVTSISEKESSYTQEELSLLIKMLQAIHLSLENDVMVVNVFQTQDQTNALVKLEDIIFEKMPKVIVPLDSDSLTCFDLKTDGDTVDWHDARGVWFDWSQGMKIIPSWHPKALLKHPPLKRDAWTDLQKIKKYLDTN